QLSVVAPRRGATISNDQRFPKGGEWSHHLPWPLAGRQRWDYARAHGEHLVWWYEKFTYIYEWRLLTFQSFSSLGSTEGCHFMKNGNIQGKKFYQKNYYFLGKRIIKCLQVLLVIYFKEICALQMVI